MAAGRPTTFSNEIALKLCCRLVEGESLRKICLDDGMPGKSTVFQWLEANQEFADQYARAREMQADTWADEIIFIADTPVLGEKTKTTDKGVEVTTGDMIEHRRLQVDARKWVAAKLKPKKYGEKLDIDHSGSLTVKAQPLDDVL